MDQTVKLYQEDVEIKEWNSVITEVIETEKGTALVLNQTAFFPEGGGQPCDLGTIENSFVTDVKEKDGVIYHYMDSTSKGKFPGVGETVSCRLDWDRRFTHMQQHCGEHILSGIFYREFSGVNKGFHMGSDYMTIDISLEENPDLEKVTWDMAGEVELKANKVIWDNLPITVTYFQTKEEAEKLPLRKALAVDEEISIVCVGDRSQPADCVACCGTHPKFSGQVGLIKILKLESYKGMTRVYCQAGKPALEDYGLKHNLVSELLNKYSAEPGTLMEKIKIQDGKNADVRSSLYRIKKAEMQRIEDEISLLIQSAFDTAAPEPLTAHPEAVQAKYLSDKIILRQCPNLSLEDLQTLGRQLTPQINGLLLLVAPEENTVMLFSNGQPDCGRIVKENASIYQGKGGGNNTCARAIFSNQDNLYTYIDLIEKHLR